MQNERAENAESKTSGDNMDVVMPLSSNTASNDSSRALRPKMENPDQLYQPSSSDESSSSSGSDFSRSPPTFNMRTSIPTLSHLRFDQLSEEDRHRAPQRYGDYLDRSPNMAEHMANHERVRATEWGRIMSNFTIAPLETIREWMTVAQLTDIPVWTMHLNLDSNNFNPALEAAHAWFRNAKRCFVINKPRLFAQIDAVGPNNTPPMPMRGDYDRLMAHIEEHLHSILMMLEMDSLPPRPRAEPQPQIMATQPTLTIRNQIVPATLYQQMQLVGIERWMEGWNFDGSRYAAGKRTAIEYLHYFQRVVNSGTAQLSMEDRLTSFRDLMQCSLGVGTAHDNYMSWKDSAPRHWGNIDAPEPDTVVHYILQRFQDNLMADYPIDRIINWHAWVKDHAKEIISERTKGFRKLHDQMTQLLTDVGGYHNSQPVTLAVHFASASIPPAAKRLAAAGERAIVNLFRVGFRSCAEFKHLADYIDFSINKDATTTTQQEKDDRATIPFILSTVLAYSNKLQSSDLVLPSSSSSTTSSSSSSSSPPLPKIGALMVTPANTANDRGNDRNRNTDRGNDRSRNNDRRHRDDSRDRDNRNDRPRSRTPARHHDRHQRDEQIPAGYVKRPRWNTSSDRTCQCRPNQRHHHWDCVSDTQGLRRLQPDTWRAEFGIPDEFTELDQWIPYVKPTSILFTNGLFIPDEERQRDRPRNRDPSRDARSSSSSNQPTAAEIMARPPPSQRK